MFRTKTTATFRRLDLHVELGEGERILLGPSGSQSTGIFEMLINEVKVGVKVKAKFTLEEATKALRGSGNIALLFLQQRL